MRERLCQRREHRFIRDEHEMRGYRCLDCPLKIPTDLIRNLDLRGWASIKAYNMDPRVIEAAEREWAIKELES